MVLIWFLLGAFVTFSITRVAVRQGVQTAITAALTDPAVKLAILDIVETTERERT